MHEKLQQICRAFGIVGEQVGYEKITIGNINQTYRVDYVNEGKEKSYLVQRVNTNVFKKPVQVMENIDKVTEYIHAKNPDRTALHFHHTADRKTYLFDEEGGFWRLCNYIVSDTYGVTRDLEVVGNAGEAFGEFQMMLADFDATTLHETIEGFHNTSKRYDKLMADVAADPVGRVAEVQDIIDWLVEVREKACRLTTMHEAGQLPLRVTHNDTKINNVLFDKETKKALVVIDLDTVMPGLVGHDFGDSIRFSANYVIEDSPEFDQVGINLDVFRAYADGFLKWTAKTLTQAEIDTLALSAFVMTTELVVRFLNDYIEGDVYFKLNYPEHNLVRSKNQFLLAKDMLAKLPEMEAIVRECAAKYC